MVVFKQRDIEVAKNREKYDSKQKGQGFIRFAVSPAKIKEAKKYEQAKKDKNVERKQAQKF